MTTRAARRRAADRLPSRVPSGPAVLLAVGLVYLAMSQVSVWLNDPAKAGAGLWPAAGVTLGALVLLPPSRWGWVLSAVLLAEVGGDVARGYPLAAAVGWAAGNMVEPWLGAVLLRRHGNRAGALSPVAPLLRFLLLAVVAAPVVGGTVGTAATVLFVGGGFGDVWPKYVVGDGVGVLTVAPLLLAWRTPRPYPRSPWEAAVLGLGVVVVGVLVLSDLAGSWSVSLAYLLIPFFTWAALRYGALGVAVLSVPVAVVGEWVTANGLGAFAHAAEPAGGHAVVLLQLFLAVSVSSALVVAALVDDLDDRRQVEVRLRHQATHDALTGLPNRALLSAAVDAAVTARHEPGRGPVLLVCDMDDFKSVNDTYGHAAGDALLVETGRRLRAGVRNDDLVARISGDEFVVLVRDADDVTVRRLAERVVAVVAEPFTVPAGARTPGAVLRAGLSVGTARAVPAGSPDDLFAAADAALYAAKGQGRARVVHAGLDAGADSHGAVDPDAGIREAGSLP